MKIDSLRLQKFRSYRDAAFEFEPGVNIIVGPNASGKTNLLESLLVACLGRSFRARDSELPHFAAPWSRIDITGPDMNRTVKIVLDDNGSIKKEFITDGQIFSRMSLARAIPVVLFEPNHLLLIHGSPEARRDYLDTLLEQTSQGFGKTRRDYKRILAQRNALLKQIRIARNIEGRRSLEDQLFAWNVRLSEIGAHIALARDILTKDINHRLGTLYSALAGSTKTTVAIHYAPTFDLESYSSVLFKALERCQQQDMERGFTTVGPHREDLVVLFDERGAAEVASRGEIRTLLLTLKIIELELIQAAREQKPLLLLDDVFSELDGKRRQALIETLKPYQTFITTTDADIILHHFTDQTHVIPLG